MADPLLRLIAFDTEDLGVVSAHIQDSVLRVGDMAFDANTRVFALLANRFDWNCMARDGQPCRRRAALEIHNVHHVRSRGLDMQKPDQVLNLLAVTFEQSQEPAGDVVLHFSGDAGARLSVECLEAVLCDLGETWQTKACPRHETASEET
jgi:hypothetical protein